MVYESLYRRQFSYRSKPIRKVVVFDGKTLDIAEEIKRLKRVGVHPGSVIWENILNALKEKWKSIYDLYNIFDDLEIKVYIFIDGSFIKMNDLLTRISEELKKIDDSIMDDHKNRRAIIERRVAEKLQAFMPKIYKKFIDVEVTQPIKYTMKIKIFPMNGYEHFFEDTTPDEVSLGPEAIPRSVMEFRQLDKFLMRFIDSYLRRKLKPSMLMKITDAIARYGLERGLKLFMHMCQEGSSLHCTAIYNFLSTRVDRDLINTRDKFTVRTIIEELEAAGFDRTAEFFDALEQPISIYAPEMVPEKIGAAFDTGLKQVLSRYAPVVDPSTAPEEIIEKSRQIMETNTAKSITQLMDIEDVDEVPIFLEFEKIKDPFVQKALRGVPQPEIKKAEIPEKPYGEEQEEIEKMRKRLREMMKKLEEEG